jgi:hypothetical protein
MSFNSLDAPREMTNVVFLTAFTANLSSHGFTPVPDVFLTFEKTLYDFKIERPRLFLNLGLSWVPDGERSRNIRLHRATLCQLSYRHHSAGKILP